MEEHVISLTCSKCEVHVQEDHRFCHNCGNYLPAEAVTINIFNNADLRHVFIFYFIYLFTCLLIKHTSWFNAYQELFWVELILAFITLRFAWLNWQQIKPILRFNNFSWSVLTGVILTAAVGSLLVTITVRELNVSFFHSELSYYEAYRLYHYPVLVMLYSIALMPALFEELAFRGVMFNYCANFLDERLVVAVTAFLFAIIHLNLMSLVWLIPFAFFLGNLRRKYNTLWYGVVFHFIFNFTACAFDLYKLGEVF
ncbi:MAG: CPBP family glutamic-type intramembrane protease [Bacteroidota bacterium]|nr:CPBP family glutamic-type intramembrane protease [Bacteroidota bacterium]